MVGRSKRGLSIGLRCPCNKKARETFG